MTRYRLGICLTLCLLMNSGCQCFRATHWYADRIDDAADYKAELDPLYVPGLDISRTGMPDWQRFGWNRFLCPCADGVCRRNQRPVYYPAEYRMKFWEMQAELEQEIATEDLPADVEEAPLPLPVE